METRVPADEVRQVDSSAPPQVAFTIGQLEQPAVEARRLPARALVHLSILVLLMLVICLGVLVAAPKTPRASIGPDVGEEAPDFTLKNVAGVPVSLHSFRGHPTVVLFWAVNCSYCQDELSGLKRAFRDIPHPPTLVAVDVWHEAPDYVAWYVHDASMPGTVLVDPFPKHTPQNVYYGPYRGYYVPSAFYLDAQGIVRGSAIGEETYDDFVANFSAYASG
jgi:thiol-disulfide isomerase/thioredoxin